MVFLFLVLLGFVYSQYTLSAGTTAANSRSQELADAINDWRDSLGKDPLPISKSLTLVAQLRVDDYQNVYTNLGESYNSYYDNAGCCPYYSWSMEGPYEGICYPYSGGTEPWAIVTGRGEEMSTYSGLIYPNPTASGTYNSAEDCIEYWNSSSRGDRMMNFGFYDSSYYEWQAFGCAYTTGTNSKCSCWVGMSDDVDDMSYSCDSEVATSTSSCGGVTEGFCVGTDECRCYPGFFTDEQDNAGTCVECVLEGCKACEDVSTCTWCEEDEGWYLYDSKCQTCDVDNCETCTDTDCTECKSGYTLDANACLGDEEDSQVMVVVSLTLIVLMLVLVL